MHCPRCESSTLDERDRDGVVIDVCRSCRGIWLDRGELEKLLARAADEFNAYAPPEARYDTGRWQEKHQRPLPQYDREKAYRDVHHKRPKSWFNVIEDIFD